MFSAYLPDDQSFKNDESLELYLEFNEGTGTQIYDSSSKSRAITELLWDGDEWSTSSYNEEADYCVEMDNESAYATMDGEDVDDHGWTIGGWYKLDSEHCSGVSNIMGGRFYDASSFDFSLAFYKSSDDRYYVNLFATTSVGLWYTDVNVTDYLEWNSYIVTWDGNISNDPKMYINGTQVTLTESSTPSGSVRDVDRFYACGNASAWGLMDNVMVYSTALSSNEIQRLYQSHTPLNVSGLYYSDEVTLSSWTVGTLIDDIRLIGIGSSALPTDSDDSSNYYFNGNGLALKVDTIHSTDGVTKFFDSEYLIRDYNTLSFDLMVTTLWGNSGNPDWPSVVITDGSDIFRAELSPFSTEDDVYYHYGGVKTINKWYHFNLNLMAFSDSNGDCPDDQSLFAELQFFSTPGTFYLDNVILAGSKGTLIVDDFEDISYHASYSDGVLVESATRDMWSDDVDPSDVTVTIVGEHALLANSPILIDIQEIENVMAVVQGDEGETMTLRLYAYKEDGTKVTSGTNYLDVITTDDVLQGWDVSNTRVSNILSLNNVTRFLGCPEVIAATGRFAIDYLGTPDSDTPMNKPYITNNNSSSGGLLWDQDMSSFGSWSQVNGDTDWSGTYYPAYSIIAHDFEIDDTTDGWTGYHYDGFTNWWNPTSTGKYSVLQRVNIVEANYAIEGKDLYFMVKWNGSLPASINSNNLTAPRYLIYRRVYISWIINDGSSSISSRLALSTLKDGSLSLVFYEFIERAVNFHYSTSSIPFVNETTAAIKVVYQKSSIPVDLLSPFSITPVIRYIGYHQFQSDLQSLSDLPESPPESIKPDGNLSDWSNSDVNSIQMTGDKTVTLEEFIFPTYNSILVSRTTEGIYGAVTLSNNNFTRFITKFGNLRADIYWVTVLAAVNGSYAADYAFEVVLSFNYTTGYSIQNVSIALNAGTGFSPSIVKNWQISNDQSGTEACLECFFPASIISELYDRVENIHFYSSIDIEWF